MEIKTTTIQVVKDNRLPLEMIRKTQRKDYKQDSEELNRNANPSTFNIRSHTHVSMSTKGTHLLWKIDGIVVCKKSKIRSYV